MCGGLDDGSIRVWNRATLEVERTLIGHTGSVISLLSVGGWLISGSDDHGIRVWDVSTGLCKGMLEGHARAVSCLAARGGRLVSGSWDRTAKIWRMEGAVSTWQCERTITGHGSAVNCMAMWGGKMGSGSADRMIRVWDVAAGTLEQTLEGHEGGVLALVTCGQCLISSSMDKTVKVWAMATWSCVRTVQTYTAESVQYTGRLTVSGSTLIGGSYSYPRSRTEQYEVRVWDLDTLEPLHTFKQAAGQRVLGLASDGEEMFAVVGKDVVMWGHQKKERGIWQIL